jgi:zinc transporter ZupT
MNNLLNVLIYSLLAGLAMMVGVYVVRYFDRRAQKATVFLISLAAGILLANAFFHLLPESTALTPTWPYWTLGALVVLYLIEHSIVIHSCREESCQVHENLGIMSLIGVGFHSLLDGMIISITFQANFIIGLTTSSAIIFHKLAEGGCTYALFICDEKSRSKAVWFSWLIALATPLGASLTYFLTAKISNFLLGGLLAAAAGSLIYIGASDLLPATHKKQNILNIFLFLAGVVFVFLIARFAS